MKTEIAPRTVTSIRLFTFIPPTDACQTPGALRGTRRRCRLVQPGEQRAAVMSTGCDRCSAVANAMEAGVFGGPTTRPQGTEAGSAEGPGGVAQTGAAALEEAGRISSLEVGRSSFQEPRAPQGVRSAEGEVEVAGGTVLGMFGDGW